MTEHEKILPCPWCGGNAVPSADHYGEQPKHFVQCADWTCAKGPILSTEREAIVAWNAVARFALELSYDYPLTKRKDAKP